MLTYDYRGFGLSEGKSTEKNTYRDRALKAAINGYLRADADPIRASALVVLAEALEANGRGRAMIPALRLAQAIAPRQDTEDMLDDAIGKYGFRIVEHTIDNDAARPRICAEFSEPLVRAGVDYSPYVQVPEASSKLP